MSARPIQLLALHLFAFSTVTRGEAPALPGQPHIVVVGEGSAQSEADYLELGFSVSLTRETGQEARQAVDEKATAVAEALRTLAVKREQVTIGPLMLDPVYDYESHPPTLIGYEAVRWLELTLLDMAMFDEVVTGAIEAGVTSVSRPTVRSRRESELVEEAEAEAIGKARERAQSLAQGFGRRLGSVYGVASADALMWPPRRGGGSIFGDPEEPELEAHQWLAYTPEPVTVSRSVYAVFLLGPDVADEEADAKE